MKEIIFKTLAGSQVSLRGTIDLWIHSEKCAALQILMDDTNTRYSLLTFCVNNKLDFWVHEEDNTFHIDLYTGDILAINF